MGPGGSAAASSCQAVTAAPSSRACASRSTGEASTRWIRAAARKGRATSSAARSASAISVPRPGPHSTSSTGSGRPIASQTVAAQRPSTSPKAWEISGAVVKSPPRPNGSRAA
jgi:hypothetical protein